MLCHVQSGKIHPKKISSVLDGTTLESKERLVKSRNPPLANKYWEMAQLDCPVGLQQENVDLCTLVIVKGDPPPTLDAD